RAVARSARSQERALRARRPRSHRPDENAGSPTPPDRCGQPSRPSPRERARESAPALPRARWKASPARGRARQRTSSYEGPLSSPLNYHLGPALAIASEPRAQDRDREVLAPAAVGVAERGLDAAHLVLAGPPHHLQRRFAEAKHARGADRVRVEHAARWVDR